VVRPAACRWSAAIARSVPSDEPRNRRSRPSIAVEQGKTRLLIDAATDLREQLLANGLSRFDAVFLTHEHADHTNGIDDLRSINFQMD